MKKLDALVRFRDGIVSENRRMLIHPLGFLYFEIRRAEMTTIRLHVWPEYQLPSPARVTNIHTHDWHLKSTIFVENWKTLCIPTVRIVCIPRIACLKLNTMGQQMLSCRLKC